MSKEDNYFYKKFGDEEVFCLEYDKATLVDMVCILQQRIDQAIDLLEKNIYNKSNLLNILKGEDKE